MNVLTGAAEPERLANEVSKRLVFEPTDDADTKHILNPSSKSRVSSRHFEASCDTPGWDQRAAIHEAVPELLQLSEA
jgi:hypothetical protein